MSKQRVAVELFMDRQGKGTPLKGIMEVDEQVTIVLTLPEGNLGEVLTMGAEDVEFKALPVNPYPVLPDTDGEYKLVITDGVPTWVGIVAEPIE